MSRLRKAPIDIHAVGLSIEYVNQYFNLVEREFVFRGARLRSETQELNWFNNFAERKQRANEKRLITIRIRKQTMMERFNLSISNANRNQSHAGDQVNGQNLNQQTNQANAQNLTGSHINDQNVNGSGSNQHSQRPYNNHTDPNLNQTSNLSSLNFSPIDPNNDQLLSNRSELYLSSYSTPIRPTSSQRRSLNMVDNYRNRPVSLHQQLLVNNLETVRFL